MNLDGFEFDKVILKNLIVLNTLIIYFDEGIFGQVDLMKGLFNHFGSDSEWARVRETPKREKARDDC